MTRYRVDQIDHVELVVPDREAAARWYRVVLGLEPVPGYEQWAEDARGPLMISSDGGSTKLALFRGGGQGSHARAGFRLVAFRTNASGFIEFLNRLEKTRLTDSRGKVVDAADVVDHDRSYSIYFCDPDGNELELTTYDHAEVSSRLRR